MPRRNIWKDESALRHLGDAVHGQAGWKLNDRQGVVQVQPWLPDEDVEWLEKHLELAGCEYSERWWNSLFF